MAFAEPCPPDARAQNATRRREILFARLGFAALLGLLFFNGSGWISHPVLNVSFYAVCFFLTMAGTLGRLWSGLYICGYKSERLIDCGPYSVMRHPLYFFSTCASFGVALATQNAWIVLLLGVFLVIRYPRNVRFEESLLRARFGADYDAYCLAVPRFSLNLRGLHAPATYEVKTGSFCKALVDAMWFLWAFFLVVALRFLVL